MERFVKSYNITLSEAELLDVVTALTAASGRVLPTADNSGPGTLAARQRAVTEMVELSRRIVDEAAEQYHDGRHTVRSDGAVQLSLPFEEKT
tara:strand:- start:925 stop:1200 length:276 start_codon:yes stop_codon:yes gene_type:complete